MVHYRNISGSVHLAASDHALGFTPNATIRAQGSTDCCSGSKYRRVDELEQLFTPAIVSA
jgi:hypothetical protein